MQLSSQPPTGNVTATLQGEALLANQIKLVAPTTVAGALYGIAFTVFCLYVHSLTSQLRDGDRKKRANFMLGYSTVLLLCGMYSLIAKAVITQNAYIKHNNYPGGPLLYIQSIYHTTPVYTVFITCALVVDILTSAIQIWRVWVIWSATGYAPFVTALPILCFLTVTVLKLRTIILQTTLPFAKYLRLQGRTDIVEAAMQAVTTILCTMLISLYLVFKQWQQRKLIGKSQGSAGYMNIVVMLIESYALESIWLLAIAMTANQAISVIFFAESVTYIEIIAYLLVQYRVANGKAYGSRKNQDNNISSLHWNRSDRATLQFGETSEVCAGPHVTKQPELVNIPQISRMV